MSIKLALLKSGDTIISDIKELVSDDGQVVGLLLSKPQKLSTHTPGTLYLTESENSVNDQLEVVLGPWIVLTSDDEIMLPKDWVVTIVNPIDSVKKMYLEKTNGETDKDFSPEQ